VTIYPNPVDDRLYIKGVDEGEIAVYDMGGCKVIAAILANAQAVDVSGLAKGVYTVRITTPNGKVEKKLVKK
ncbi:MAG: T9SS type A sorting domain-containing protein, partial [Bacteroidota bacterium]|nr:T9SS type A sorting domain-containing protein [Bacteroidota bacterium]